MTALQRADPALLLRRLRPHARCAGSASRCSPLLIVTPLAQIVMRGIFNVPMAGAEELARYFLITLTFVAASYVTQQGGQIRMEEFQGLVPPRPRWLLQLGIELCRHRDVRRAVASPASITIAQQPAATRRPTLEMPFWLFMGPLVVGSALLVVETLAMLVHTWRRKRPEEKHTVLT